MAQKVVNAGIDVSKTCLDVALWPTRLRLLVAYDEAGLAALAAWLTAHAVQRVGLEASGGYERHAIEALEAAGFEVARLNPLYVRRFAQAKGRLAKNDRVDALVVAHFTAAMIEEIPARRPAALEPLVEHLTIRRRLCNWITDCTNQLEQLRDARLRRKIMAHRSSFERRLVALDTAIAKLIATQDDWSRLECRLRSVPGVGPILAWTLIALVPELGHLPRREISSLIGLAPFDDDSGDRHGERHVKGGRHLVREKLHMAAVVARRYNPAIKAFADRLAGNKPKVILVACMRKLLVILNAMLRDGTDWRVPAAT